MCFTALSFPIPVKNISQIIFFKLSPLATLEGKWTGGKGDNIAPDDDKNNEENN
jgi:hypothetical protein